MLLSFIYNFAVIILTALQLVAPLQARVISDCNSVALETTEYIQNSNTACNSRYPYIYCNGEASAYCTQDECLEDYQCENEDLSELSKGEQVSATTAEPTVVITESTTTTPKTTTIVTTTTTQSTTSTGQQTAKVTPTTTATTLNISTAIKPLLASTTTIVAQNIKRLCRAGVFANYAYSRNCRYYYRCTNGYFLLQECGYLMLFDAYDGYCKSATVARCIDRLISV
uniref:Chitin-binding type-2 domain-containing protein n=1 Tax=Bactrocera latifrons TaxID=174628 RepID=A0A0K8VEX2_BACLA